jgi:hypothetical protein
MEHRPLGSTDSEVCKAHPNNDACYWAVDSKEQWISMLTMQNRAVDIWSVHHYDSANRSTMCDGGSRSCRDCFFDADNCVNGAPLTTAAAQAAKAAGKVLYQGEYGGGSPTFTGPTSVDVAYPTAVLDAQVKSSENGGHFLLSSIWAWECASQRDAMVCIWPNSSNANESGSQRMVDQITKANDRMDPNRLKLDDEYESTAHDRAPLSPPRPSAIQQLYMDDQVGALISFTLTRRAYRRPTRSTLCFWTPTSGCRPQRRLAPSTSSWRSLNCLGSPHISPMSATTQCARLTGACTGACAARPASRGGLPSTATAGAARQL